VAIQKKKWRYHISSIEDWVAIDMGNSFCQYHWYNPPLVLHPTMHMISFPLKFNIEALEKSFHVPKLLSKKSASWAVPLTSIYTSILVSILSSSITSWINTRHNNGWQLNDVKIIILNCFYLYWTSIWETRELLAIFRNSEFRINKFHFLEIIFSNLFFISFSYDEQTICEFISYHNIS